MTSPQRTQVSSPTSRPPLGGPHFVPVAEPNIAEPSSRQQGAPRPGLSHRLTRAVQVATIALFVLILLAPTIQEHRSFITCPEVNENRRKYEKPNASWVDIWLNRNNAAVAYEKYYNDTYGLRDLFIRLKNQVDFSVFGKSDKVHIGAGGWMFYRNVLDNQQVSMERMTPSQEEAVFQSVDRLAAHLQQRGIALIVMPCPQKNTIYPELVPLSVPRRPAVTFFDRYRAFLNRNPRILYVDATEILAREKASRDVFYRTDFHWTDVAAHFVGRDCLELVGRREGNAPRYHELRVRQETFSGGQAMFIPMLYTPKETADFPVKTWNDDTEMKSDVGPYEWVSRRRDGKGLPTLVVYGDSYFDGLLRSGFPTYFNAVHRARSNRQPWSAILSALPADTKYLLVEHIEVASDGTWTGLPPL